MFGFLRKHEHGHGQHRTSGQCGRGRGQGLGRGWDRHRGGQMQNRTRGRGHTAFFQPATLQEMAPATPRAAFVQEEAPRAATAGLCPLCDNHCPLDAPSCGKGKSYARSLRTGGPGIEP